ncbi:hypothetical protein KAX29_05530 [candidate division WOR-3 bacterium]|nr:hypothetical protein [candidate division WOR-3 bacterium]
MLFFKTIPSPSFPHKLQKLKRLYTQADYIEAAKVVKGGWVYGLSPLDSTIAIVSMAYSLLMVYVTMCVDIST